MSTTSEKKQHHTIDLEQVKKIITEIIKDKKIKDIAYVGCGASQSDLYAAWYFAKNNSKDLRAHIFTANEFNYDIPVWLGEHTLVVTASLGGATPETVHANHVAREHGATVISLTNSQGSALTKEANYVIYHGFYESYAAKEEKTAYALAIATELIQQTEGLDLYEDMITGFDGIFDACNKGAVLGELPAREFGVAYKDDSIIYFMSSSVTQSVAYASSLCLMMEMQWINSGNFNDGEFFHGPFEIVEKDVPFVLFMNDGPTRDMDVRALTFLERFNAKTTVIDARDYGLASAVPSSVINYFNSLLLTSVFRVFAESLAEARKHPLTRRRYMWKLEY